MDKEIKKYTLTIPDELLEEIRKMANQQGISVNAYILLLISQALKEKWNYFKQFFTYSFNSISISLFTERPLFWAIIFILFNSSCGIRNVNLGNWEVIQKTPLKSRQNDSIISFNFLF